MKRPAALIPIWAAAFVVGAAWATVAGSVEIAASQYGVATGTYPYALAKAKGLFEKHGVNVEGIRSGRGSTPTIREMVAGELPFADAGITGVLQARASGADVVPVGCAVDTFAEVIWVTKPDSPINDMADIKGKRVGYTSPKSATNMMAVMLVDKAGLPQDEVELVSVGGFNELLTALNAGGVDVIPMVEPTFTMEGDKYKVLARGNETFPPISNTMLLSSRKAIEEQPDAVRGIIAARREAVEFIRSNPEEAGELIAKELELDPEVIKKVVKNLLEFGSVDGIEYWGLGDCYDFKTVNNMLEGARTVGMIDGDFDVKSIVDLSLLPEDLQ
ncbi:nitrate/sulfonate/bicarbonate ABC transporter periplasmic ligand-binding protein [Mesorhizobium alhagi CCNWXJ12-2]|uniref:Nitrate/sulfonate/bicarbonate ABC transporter periplasmic ligand-binding protein n=1 Tax=Mesorhizobium alhagi CCNWXJ12-2 TaxID=1107882 RepID=H0HWW2_9HYPH|nr:nitrate/sulfonate/bicarbonate ABC transporter periplasmic ligand-binding protein [Mesorhizobium alhagi CCNWXJ12-2]